MLSVGQSGFVWGGGRGGQSDKTLKKKKKVTMFETFQLNILFL